MIIAASGIKIANGKVTRHNYKSASDKPYQIASCSKFITALVVAKLYEQGRLDYNTDINRYLTSWRCPKAGITLKHLLTHTSGSIDRNGFLGRDPQVPTRIGLRFTKYTFNGEGYAVPFNPVNPPGQQYMYSGAGFQVIQQIIEDITQVPLYQLMDQFIFAPLEMKNSTAEILYEGDPKLQDGWMEGLYRMYPETAAAGVWMSANDLATLLVDVMNGYNNNSSKILRQATIRMITKREYPQWDRGLGMAVGDDGGTHMFTHGGSNYGFKSKFYVIPEKRTIEIILINSSPKVHDNDAIREKAKKLLKFA